MGSGLSDLDSHPFTKTRKDGVPVESRSMFPLLPKPGRSGAPPSTLVSACARTILGPLRGKKNGAWALPRKPCPPERQKPAAAQNGRGGNAVMDSRVSVLGSFVGEFNCSVKEQAPAPKVTSTMPILRSASAT